MISYAIPLLRLSARLPVVAHHLHPGAVPVAAAADALVAADAAARPSKVAPAADLGEVPLVVVAGLVR